MHRWHKCVIAGAALIGSAGFGAALHTGETADQPMTLIAKQSAERYRFLMRAEPVGGLYPGANRRLTLTLNNPYDVDLIVTDVRASLVETSHAGCLPIAENLEIGPYTGELPLRIAAKDSQKAGVVPLQMPNSVVNACQEATFTIVLDAVAGPAS